MSKTNNTTKTVTDEASVEEVEAGNEAEALQEDVAPPIVTASISTQTTIIKGVVGAVTSINGDEVQIPKGIKDHSLGVARKVVKEIKLEKLAKAKADADKLRKELGLWATLFDARSPLVGCAVACVVLQGLQCWLASGITVNLDVETYPYIIASLFNTGKQMSQALLVGMAVMAVVAGIVFAQILCVVYSLKYVKTCVKYIVMYPLLYCVYYPCLKLMHWMRLLAYGIPLVPVWILESMGYEIETMSRATPLAGCCFLLYLSTSNVCDHTLGPVNVSWIVGLAGLMGMSTEALDLLGGFWHSEPETSAVKVEGSGNEGFHVAYRATYVRQQRTCQEKKKFFKDLYYKEQALIKEAEETQARLERELNIHNLDLLDEDDFRIAHDSDDEDDEQFTRECQDEFDRLFGDERRHDNPDHGCGTASADTQRWAKAEFVMGVRASVMVNRNNRRKGNEAEAEDPEGNDTTPKPVEFTSEDREVVMRMYRAVSIICVRFPRLVKNARSLGEARRMLVGKPLSIKGVPVLLGDVKSFVIAGCLLELADGKSNTNVLLKAKQLISGASKDASRFLKAADDLRTERGKDHLLSIPVQPENESKMTAPSKAPLTDAPNSEQPTSKPKPKPSPKPKTAPVPKAKPSPKQGPVPKPPASAKPAPKPAPSSKPTVPVAQPPAVSPPKPLSSGVENSSGADCDATATKKKTRRKKKPKKMGTGTEACLSKAPAGISGRNMTMAFTKPDGTVYLCRGVVTGRTKAATIFTCVRHFDDASTEFPYNALTVTVDGGKSHAVAEVKVFEGVFVQVKLDHVEPSWTEISCGRPSGDLVGCVVSVQIDEMKNQGHVKAVEERLVDGKSVSAILHTASVVDRNKKGPGTSGSLITVADRVSCLDAICGLHDGFETYNGQLVNRIYALPAQIASFRQLPSATTRQ